MLTIDDLDAVTVGAFLNYLDNERHNSTATRNARLAAIHSFYRYALPLIPDRAHTASQVLAIPQRRHDRAIVSYLTGPEDRRPARRAGPHHLVRAPRPRPAPYHRSDRTSRLGGDRVDHPGHHHHHTRRRRPHHGQRPKRTRHPADPADRGRPTGLAARSRARAQRPGVPDPPGNPNVCRRRSTTRRQTRHSRCTELPVASRSKHVTPHTLRHTAAMTLLHAGVDTSVIALWLGHQSPVTTHIYLHADMTIKERALARVPDRQHHPRPLPAR